MIGDQTDTFNHDNLIRFDKFDMINDHHSMWFSIQQISIKSIIELFLTNIILVCGIELANEVDSPRAYIHVCVLGGGREKEREIYI